VVNTFEARSQLHITQQADRYEPLIRRASDTLPCTGGWCLGGIDSEIQSSGVPSALLDELVNKNIEKRVVMAGSGVVVIASAPWQGRQVQTAQSSET